MEKYLSSSTSEFTEQLKNKDLKLFCYKKV